MPATTKFRQLLKEPGIITAPGAYDCLSAKLIENAGFPAVYMTGAGMSVSRIGYPDLGLATMTEMLEHAAYIADAVAIPVIADADTGYGGVSNVRRTVRQYERTGVAAIHIEDQDFPKRCGHLDDKRVISVEDMVQKIRAAVDARTDDDLTIIVRTDALAVTGWDDSMRRCEQYIKAGADVLFVEALRSQDDIERAAKNLDVPLLYNYVETGKSPLIPVSALERLGYKIVIFPITALALSSHAISKGLKELKNTGTTTHMQDRMTSLTECFEIAGLSEMLDRDARYSDLSPVDETK